MKKNFRYHRIYFQEQLGVVISVSLCFGFGLNDYGNYKFISKYVNNILERNNEIIIKMSLDVVIFITVNTCFAIEEFCFSFVFTMKKSDIFYISMLLPTDPRIRYDYTGCNIPTVKFV